jgi:hypothetical protein
MADGIGHAEELRRTGIGEHDAAVEVRHQHAFDHAAQDRLEPVLLDAELVQPPLDDAHGRRELRLEPPQPVVPLGGEIDRLAPVAYRAIASTSRRSSRRLSRRASVTVTAPPATTAPATVHGNGMAVPLRPPTIPPRAGRRSRPARGSDRRARY